MTANGSKPTALIIGASRGLGLGLVEEYLRRGWNVVGTVRAPGQTRLHAVAERSGGSVEIERLDTTIPDQIAVLAGRLQGRVFDLLFVNAGVANNPKQTIGDTSTEEFVRIMLTNTLGPMRVIEALADLVAPTGIIGVMSSGLGSVADNESGAYETYRASKAALITLMRSFAARNPARSMVIIAPGWVRTDMGGPNADLAIEDSIPRVVDTITAQTGKSGVRFLDYRGETVRW